MKKSESQKKRKQIQYNQWHEQRVIALVGQKISIKLDQLFHVREDKQSVRWILDGKEVSKEHALELQFDSPARHYLSIEYDNREVNRFIDVGVRFGDLLKKPSQYHFTYLLIGKNRGKVMFFPIAPTSQVKNLVDHRETVLAEMQRFEPAYRDFCNRQGELWSKSILRKPILLTKNLTEGVYAMFEGGLVYLGFPATLREGLQTIKSALNHDATVANAALTEPGKVFSGINNLINIFDPRHLGVDPNSILAPGSATRLEEAGAWINANIGGIFGHFLDHLGALGIDGLTSRLGAMFTFNQFNFTFSSRFSDIGLGISRHSTNMIGFGGSEGDSISLPGLLGDGSGHHFTNQGGRLGLMETAEHVDTEQDGSFVYWTKTDDGWLGIPCTPEGSSTGDVIIVPNDGRIFIGISNETSNESQDQTQGTTNNNANTNTNSNTDANTNTNTNTNSNTDANTNTNTNSNTDANTNNNTDNDTDEGPGESAPVGDHNTQGGDTTVAGVDPEFYSSSHTNFWKAPLDEAKQGMRGGGYTDPNPEYNGGGDGNFCFFLGRVGPIDENPYDTLVNPGTADVVGQQDQYEGGLIAPVDPAVDPAPDFFRHGLTTTRYSRTDNPNSARRFCLFSGPVGNSNMQGLFGFAAAILPKNKSKRIAIGSNSLKQILSRLSIGGKKKMG